MKNNLKINEPAIVETDLIREQFRISVPGFYTVKNEGRVREIDKPGEDHSEPGVWKLKNIKGEIIPYKCITDKQGAKR